MTISKRDNLSLSSVALAIGTTTTKVTTGGAAQLVIDGRAATVAAAADKFTLAGTALAAKQVCVFFMCLDAAGTASVIQSPIVAAPAAPGYVAGAFEWPDPSGKAVVGAVLINSGAAVFTPGTTALTGVATYINAALDYGKAITY